MRPASVPLPVPPSGGRRPAPPPGSPAREADAQYLVFLTEMPARGLCASCGRAQDDGGCRVLKGAHLGANVYGWRVILSVACTRPGSHAIRVGAPLA
jgi:hypothetical protein